MPKKRPKQSNASVAASALVKARWAKTTKLQRSKIASELAKAAADSMTPEERSERARKAGLAAGKKRRGEACTRT